jgi:hypothetical protein
MAFHANKIGGFQKKKFNGCILVTMVENVTTG